MTEEPLRKLIALNVAGRVLCVCRGHGVFLPAQIDIYKRAVEAAVLSLVGTEPHGIAERLNTALAEQVQLLDDALTRNPPVDVPAVNFVPVPAALQAAQTPTPESPPDQTSPPRKERHQRLQGIGTMPDPKSMEERLQEERKPISALLEQECVELELIDEDDVEHWQIELTGRTTEEGEAMLVDYLKIKLKKRIRRYIREHKGGPWDTPRQQSELYGDVQASRSVRSLIMLCGQLQREQERWGQEHGWGGLVGRLFGGEH